MKASLKLLLLVTALVAVTVAWMRARQDYAAADSQMLRNANRNAELITVSEANSPPSRLTIDASGAVSRAYLMGPEGINAIKSHDQKSDHLGSITFGSAAAVSAFDPADFPNLTRVGFDDSFDLEFDLLSLEWLEALPQLEEVCFEARSSDPRQAFSTISIGRPWKLELWTDQIESIGTFLIPRQVQMLELHVPDTRDAARIEELLKTKIAGSHIVVWDNFGPTANPL